MFVCKSFTVEARSRSRMVASSRTRFAKDGVFKGGIFKDEVEVAKGGFRAEDNALGHLRKTATNSSRCSGCPRPLSASLGLAKPTRDLFARMPPRASRLPPCAAAVWRCRALFQPPGAPGSSAAIPAPEHTCI